MSGSAGQVALYVLPAPAPDALTMGFMLAPSGGPEMRGEVTMSFDDVIDHVLSVCDAAGLPTPWQTRPVPPGRNPGGVR